MMQRPRRGVPLRWRLVILLAVLALLNLLDTWQTVASEDRIQQLEHTEDALHRAARVEERLRGNRDGQLIELRGFGLTGRPVFLRQFRARAQAENAQVAELRRLLRGEPDLQAEASGATAAMAAWRAEAAEPTIAAVQAGREERAARLVARSGEPMLDEVRAASASFSRVLDRRLDEIRAVIDGSRTRLNRRLLLTTLLALLVVAGSAWAMRRWITLPVAGLSRHVSRVADGHVREQVEGTGPTEFEALGEDVERMRRRIVTELEQSRRAVEALEQHAPLVTSLRSQLRATTDADVPEGLRVVGRLEPAHGVLAGDWYDVIALDESRAVVIVVDVSGHGPEAGLRALWLKHLLSPVLRMGLEPGDALNWVASEMGDTGEWFATGVIIEIDVQNGRCRYANAGHPPPLLVGRHDVQELRATGTVFGPLVRQRWDTADATLDADRMLVVYTDGITESRNAEGVMFGTDRLVACFRTAEPVDPARAADAVLGSVHAFGPGRLKDDATLAVVTCAPAGDDLREGAERRRSSGGRGLGRLR